MTSREIKDGGPAFPRTGEGVGNPRYDEPGMSLRDYFAAQALEGMLSHSTRYRPRDGRQDWHSAIAEEAYELADALLKARSEKEE